MSYVVGFTSYWYLVFVLSCETLSVNLTFIYQTIFYFQNFHLCIYSGMLVSTLAKYRSRPRVYIGCMKSGPVLYQK